VLRNRAALVDELYAATPDTRVILVQSVEMAERASPESETAHG
jgi:hypothetical protein